MTDSVQRMTVINLTSTAVGHNCVNSGIVTTTSISERLVRLPLWLGLEEQQAEVIQTIVTALE